ncbi:MAG: bifunctional diaminohydroxyphosphoribosylaminopyrimidine deaminase/5-amino-6-(5-phosphoribosylamino)uracil reductase RibD [Dysgonomonas sp.]
MAMNVDEKYILRCLQLAQNGKGRVNPNPMVGAVVVHNNKIVGEGYHRKYGCAHAEVNAIDSVKDRSLLSQSTLYVSLEPCSHYGKTPPCAKLIIESKIPRVVIAVKDPNPKVSGRGIQMLRDAGIEVVTGILEKEAREINKPFFCFQEKHRPYIYLKWAQTFDGFIDKLRQQDEKPQPTLISNSFSKMLVHKKRSEIMAIMIGTNTALKDNPVLTTREWYGDNPIRIVIDRLGRIPEKYQIFNSQARTICFTEVKEPEISLANVTFIQVRFDEKLLSNILSNLYYLKINSLLVEGGQQLLVSFIKENFWDEAYVEIADKEFGNGVKAPHIDGETIEELYYGKSKHLHLKNADPQD